MLGEMLMQTGLDAATVIWVRFYYTKSGIGLWGSKKLGRFYRMVERLLLYNFIMLWMPVNLYQL